MSKKLSRRQFLKALGAAGAGLMTTGLWGKSLPRVIAQAWNDHLYLPLVSRGGTIPSSTRTSTPTSTITPTATITPPATDTTVPGPSPTPTITRTPGVGSRVVHVHNPDATSWAGSTDYWNYVDQDVVNTMVDQGMMAMTGKLSVADAWKSLLPYYQSGEGIAVKVNFNNKNTGCDEINGKIDAIIHPVNAIMRGLKQIGVRESDLWVYDATKPLPYHFTDACIYEDIQFFDLWCHNKARYSSDDPNAVISFQVPPGIPLPDQQKVTDVLVDASYVINVPIMKAHACVGVTLAFKNHFGSIQKPLDMHKYTCNGRDYSNPDYSPLVDIYRNPNIVGKTILTIGDAIFANWMNNVSEPKPWTTFNNDVPNSLFFSTDPVAIDCVMCDYLHAELAVPDYVNDYLQLASSVGLGTFERGDPWGSGYTQINYSRIDL